MTSDLQDEAARDELIERHKLHDEQTFGLRPDVVLHASKEDADWIRNPAFWRSGEADDAPGLAGRSSPRCTERRPAVVAWCRSRW